MVITIKKILITLCLFLYLFLLTGCFLLNNAPIIESSPPLIAKVGIPYIYYIDGIDPDNDTLEYSLLTFPEGMMIDSESGAINWTPSEEQLGENKVEVKANDQWSNDTQSFSIIVSKAILTSIEVLPETMSLISGNSWFITSVIANYDYGTSKTVSTSDCVYESSNANIASVDNDGIVKAISIGSAVITASYSEDGFTKSDTVNVTVTTPPISPPSSGG